MDSSGNDYEAGDHSGGEDSSDVSLVEESDLVDIITEASSVG